MNKFMKWYMDKGLVFLIVIGLCIGLSLAMLALNIPALKPIAINSGLLGTFFISSLKSVAPVLVFVLVLNAITSHKAGKEVYIKPIILLYLLGTFSAALVAVLMSFAFPSEITLVTKEISIQPPSGVMQVLKTLFLNIADNPIHALIAPNYIGILTWAILIGFTLRHADESVKVWVNTLSESVTQIVFWVIRLAPIGIMGLVASTIAETGFEELKKYGHLIGVLLASMAVMALIVNPLIVFFKTRQNPYPLVFRCLSESGITAFFTRSSAANIPVNMNLCKKLGLHKDTYSISIPLGATINMAGASITITVLTLAVTHTLHIPVDFFSAVLLCSLASLAACGASGVPGGSLLLIPMACGLFNITDDIAMQMVAVGMIIGVIQDSAETALNSSTDVLYTAAVDIGEQRLKNKVKI